MSRSTRIVLAVAGVCIVLVIVIVWWRRPAGRESSAAKNPTKQRSVPSVSKPSGDDAYARKRKVEPTTPRALTAEEKAARIDKIKRDYDDIRAKTSADYSAAGASFPGGLNAFLRQLALLEREKRADFAAVLSPEELEQLEMKETNAGLLVERLLGPTSATPDQRRAVFRLQLAFEDRFALTFDLTPAALLERETARQQLQQKIRGVLGDELFATWLNGEGEDYTAFVTFAARYGLPSSVPFDLRQVKNDFVRQRLELNAAQGMSPGQLRAAQAALVQQTEARVIQIVGPGAAQAGRADILSWLPKR
jgi:hypothetical protein